jgi:hypothetical protein
MGCILELLSLLNPLSLRGKAQKNVQELSRMFWSFFSEWEKA